MTLAYRIDGIVPREVVEPESAEAFASAVAQASAAGAPVVFRGGGTRMGWGRQPEAVDLVVSTSRLRRVLRYEPGDLTVSVEAGLTINALNQELARHGQMLPVDAPSDASTIGGAIATNDSGPLRHRYGSIRDQLIGIRLATTDGKLASAGGNVVKNVAGYDLGKLVSGSFGALAGIVSATFKLAPIPAATETLRIPVPDGDTLGQAADALASSQIDMMCLEAHATMAASAQEPSSYALFARVGGPEAVNRAQLLSVATSLSGIVSHTMEHLTGESERAEWRARGAWVWSDGAVAVRAGWLPASLGRVLAETGAVARATGVHIELRGRAAMGTGVFHLRGEAAAVADAITRLRALTGLVSHVIVMRAPADVRARVDVWGAPPSAASVLGAIKRALDPAGVLNAGRGPI